MVEFILVSVAVVAVVSFLLNIRSLRGAAPEHRVLDGNPRWERGVIRAVDRADDYLAIPTAKVVVEIAERVFELVGPLPPHFVAQIKAGLEVEGHLEYDQLDTIRTELWDGAPQAVLQNSAQQMSVEPASEDANTISFEREGQRFELGLADDGWLMLTHHLAVPHEVSADLRANFDAAENAHMLTKRLGIMPDYAENADALSTLSEDTLSRLEAFAVQLDGWTCIDHEAIEFECALPFPEASLVAALLDELVPLSARVGRELTSPTSVDEGW